jgi:hypothetical protein
MMFMQSKCLSVPVLTLRISLSFMELFSIGIKLDLKIINNRNKHQINIHQDCSQRGTSPSRGQPAETRQGGVEENRSRVHAVQQIVAALLFHVDAPVHYRYEGLQTIVIEPTGTSAGKISYVCATSYHLHNKVMRVNHKTHFFF